MSMNMTNFDAVLKEFYEGPIRKTMWNKVELMKYLQKSERMFSGRRIVFPVHVKRNPGVGARGETSALPAAGNQSYVEARITATYQYGRIQLTGVIMEASKNAFAEAVATEVEGCVTDLKFDVARQTYSDSLGRLAQVGAIAASTSLVTVFNQWSEPGQPGAKWCQEGQRLSFGSIATNSADGTGSIISISIPEGTATTVDTITISATSLDLSACTTFLFNNGVNSVEMMGVRGIVDKYGSDNIWVSGCAYTHTAVLQNINRSTYSRYNASVFGNSQVARVMDSLLIQRAFDGVEKNIDAKVGLIIGEYDTITVFGDAVSTDRRYNSPQFDVGFQALTFNGKPLVKDLLAPYNELFFLGERALEWYVLSDFSWSNKDGSIWKNVTGYDAYEAFIRAYIQLGGESINGNAVIRDIKTNI